jgi:hypothetical protein
MDTLISNPRPAEHTPPVLCPVALVLVADSNSRRWRDGDIMPRLSEQMENGRWRYGGIRRRLT